MTLNKERLEKRAEKARIALGLTGDQLKRLQGYAHQVYEEIAADLPPDNKRQSTCKRSTILEVVIDASRLETQMRRGEGLSGVKYRAHEKDPEADHPMVRACRDFGTGRIADLIGPAFPYSHYEVSGREW